MAVLKLSKQSNHRRAAHLNVAFQSKNHSRFTKKKGLKKVYLKSQCRNAVLLPEVSSKKPKKKVLCVKKKCHIRKMLSNKIDIPSTGHLKDKVMRWLKNSESEHKNLSDEQENPECGTKCSNDDEIINVNFEALPEKKELHTAAETSQLSSMEIHADTTPKINEKLPAPTSASHLNSSSPSSFIFCDGLLDSQNEPKSEEVPSQNDLSAPDSSNPTGVMMKERTSQSLIHPGKHLKTSRVARKKKLRQYLLRNAHYGCLRASHKFRKRQLDSAIKQRKCGGKIGHFQFICHDSTGCSTGGDQMSISQKNSDSQLEGNVPLEVKAGRRLVSSIFTNNFNKTCSMNEEQEHLILPRKKKNAYKFKPSYTGSKMQSGIFFSVEPNERPNPCYQSSFSTLEEVEASTAHSTGKNREVCYIFALIDKEKDETIFKTSPQMKSSHLLEELGRVLNMISADEDISCLPKPVPEHLQSEVYTPNLQCADTPTLKDGWTSPASFLGYTSDKSCQCDEEPSSPKQVSREEDTPASFHKEAPGTENVPDSKVDLKKPTLNSNSKVIISQALLNFISEWNNLTDRSIKFLKWCSGTVKSDIDSGSSDDDFEGFLCHCHDKVSIVIECLSELDAKQIINIDENELKLFWLLHDAMCCILQAYRYLQCPSSEDSFNSQLISLMMTCSKMIVPRGKLNVKKWISMMTMVSDICSRLQTYDLLPDACKCRDYFVSLTKDRYCRVCKFNCFFEEMCPSDEITSSCKMSRAGSNLQKLNTSVLEQLFPRFYNFLNEVEDWCEEEFKSAFLKHSVVQFSCNVDSGLYPCDEHMSAITCNCFSPSRVLDAGLLLDDNAYGPCTSSKSNGLSKDEDKQNFCSANKPNLEKTSSPECDDERRNDALKKKTVQRISHEKSCNEINHVHEHSERDISTINVSSERSKRQTGNESLPNCEDATSAKSFDTTVTVSGEESSTSSQDYILKIDSSSETEQEKVRPEHPTHVHILPNYVKRNGDLEENLNNDTDSSNKTESTVILKSDSEQVKKNMDDSLLTESLCFDYSPLNVKQAQRKTEKVYSSQGVSFSYRPKTEGFDEQGVIDQSIEESAQSSITESSKPEVDTTESLQSEDLLEVTSLSANKGSLSEDTNDAVPYQETESNQDSSIIILSSPLRSPKSFDGESQNDQQNFSKSNFAPLTSDSTDNNMSMGLSDEILKTKSKEKKTARKEIKVDSSQDNEAHSCHISQDQSHHNMEERKINEKSDSISTLPDTEAHDSTLDIVSSNEDSHEVDSDVHNGVTMVNLDSKLSTRNASLPHCCVQVGRKDPGCPCRESHFKYTFSQEAERVVRFRNQHFDGNEDHSTFEERHESANVHAERRRSKAPVSESTCENTNDSNLENGIKKSRPLISNQVMESKGAGKEIKKHQSRYKAERELTKIEGRTLPKDQTSLKKDSRNNELHSQTEARPVVSASSSTKLDFEKKEVASQEHIAIHHAKKLENEMLRHQLLSQRKRSIEYEGCESDLETSLANTNNKQHETKAPKHVKFVGIDFYEEPGKKAKLAGIDNYEEPSKRVRFSGIDTYEEPCTTNQAFGKKKAIHGTVTQKIKSNQSQDCNPVQKDYNVESLSLIMSDGNAPSKKLKNGKSIAVTILNDGAKVCSNRQQENPTCGLEQEEQQTDGKAKSKSLHSAMKKSPSTSKFDYPNTSAAHAIQDCCCCSRREGNIRCGKEGFSSEPKHLHTQVSGTVCDSERIALSQTRKKQRKMSDISEFINTPRNTQLLQQENYFDIPKVKGKKHSKHNNVLEDATDVTAEKKRKVACLNALDDNTIDMDVVDHKRKKDYKKCANMCQNNISNVISEKKEESNIEDVKNDATNHKNEAKSKRKKNKNMNVLENNVSDAHTDIKCSGQDAQNDGTNDKNEAISERKKSKDVNALENNVRNAHTEIEFTGQNAQNSLDKAKSKRRKHMKSANVEGDAVGDIDCVKVKNEKCSKIINQSDVSDFAVYAKLKKKKKKKSSKSALQQ